MSKLTRVFQRIFAGTYVDAPSGQIAQFGSLAAGAKLYTSDAHELQGLPQFQGGWLAGCVGNHSPTLEDMNALFYLLTRQVAYLMQQGIPEWDFDTEYAVGALCANDGVIYRCVAVEVGAQIDNRNVWIPLTEFMAPVMPGVAKAWARFTDNNAGVVTLVASHNVSGISLLSPGNYQITFDSGIFPDTGYTYNLSSTQHDTSGTVQIMTRFAGDLKSTTAFQFRSINVTDSNSQYTPEGCVTLFR